MRHPGTYNLKRQSIKVIRPNPEGSFKLSGTMVNTITLFVRKPMCDKGLLHVG